MQASKANTTGRIDSQAASKSDISLPIIAGLIWALISGVFLVLISIFRYHAFRPQQPIYGTGPVSRGDDGAIRHCCKGLLEYHIVSCSIFDSIGPGKYYGNMIYIADGAKYDMVIHGKAQEYSNTMLVLADLGGLALALQTSIYQ
ncbi:hypothetical protein TWF217_007794 [Orbilia oligospora]|nr:hypothetical protein TWF217_007794 [Orbilia oligospora]